MNHLLHLACLLFCTALAAGGCEHAASSPASAKTADSLAGKLIVTGSSTVAPLASEMAKRFEQLHPSVRIDVQTGGSGQGIAEARSGVADIGMASRALKAGEGELVAHPIAADGVGLIVHDTNPVQHLSDRQVIDIFTDRASSWRELGGLDVAITVVHKAEGRATLEVFLEHFGLTNPEVEADVIVGDNQHAVKTVAGVPGAIGYVSIGTAVADARAGEPIRLLPIDGITANSANVAAGKFPIRRPLNFVTKFQPSNLASAFIQYCQSEEVHDIVVGQNFVPLQD